MRKGIDLLARLWADTLEPTYVYDQGRCYQKGGHAEGGPWTLPRSSSA